MSLDVLFRVYSNYLKRYAGLAVVLILLGSCQPVNEKNDTSATVNTPDSSFKNPDLKQVTFFPYWVANAQFVGYYMAVEKGYYRNYGIDMHIIPYQPFITTNEIIREGKADFAALWLVNAIELKASGVDIVNIAQPSTRSSLMLITKKTSNISTLEQMNGKKAGIWSGFEMQPKALFKKYNLDVTILPIGSSNNLFLMDGVDITIANWFDEYHSLLNHGLDSSELNTFFFADYGLNFLEDGIYCSAEMRKNDPELCANFVKATLEGWKFAFDNPEAAIDLVMKYAHEAKLPVNKVHQKWMLDRYEDLYRDSNNEFNTKLRKEEYESVGHILLESGLINTMPSYDDFCQPIINK